MKIAIASDLHIESKFNPRKKTIKRECGGFHADSHPSLHLVDKNIDVLLVAGDMGFTRIDTQPTIDKLKEYEGKLYKKLLVINGNHDYYDPFFAGCRNSEQYDEIRSWDSNPDDYNPLKQWKNNVVEWEKDNVVFLGTTMWTPITDPVTSYIIEKSMNDFRLIPHHTIEEANQLYKEESKWLYDKIVEYTDKGKELVIMTHHSPFPECIHPNYRTGNLSYLNAAYSIIDEKSPFYDFINNTNIKFWLFGHTHERFEVDVGNIKCICNAVGYYETPTFEYKIIEI